MAKLKISDITFQKFHCDFNLISGQSNLALVRVDPKSFNFFRSWSGQNDFFLEMVYTLVQLQWADQQYQCLAIHVGAIVLRDEKDETLKKLLNSKRNLETGENLKLTPMNIGVKTATNMVFVSRMVSV